MLISHKNKKLVLNLRDPSRVTTVIRGCKVLEYNGKRLVAVPHGNEEVRVLRNLGINAPAPIHTQYGWPGMFKPFYAQYHTAEFLTLNDRGFCLSEPGTGKTLSALWAYDYLRSIGQAKRLLIVAPLSTLERAWADEIFSHMPHLTWAVLHGDKPKRLKMLNSNADVFIINHDGVKVIDDELAAATMVDTVVIDEIATFRNPGSLLFKSMQKIVKGRRRVWGLTGTPTPNEPTDAWAQCRLVVPERVPRFMGAFREQTMKKRSNYEWVARDTAIETVAQAMRPSIRFSRDECSDLPECMVSTRAIEMSPEQKKAYKNMTTQLFADLQAGQVLAVNEAVKLGKLIQIASGAVRGPDGMVHRLPCSNRINELLDIIRGAASKVIVYVPHLAVIDHVKEEVEKHFTCEVINGGVSKSARDSILTAFQKGKDLKVLIAQPDTISHGLTLTAANTIVWYAPITSAETYEQANARITRPGQKLAQHIVHIEGSPVERRVYKRLKQKISLQGILLDEIQGADQT